MRTGVDCKGREWEERDLSDKRKNLSGVQIGLLKALFPVNVKGRNRYFWLCHCGCGNEIVVEHCNLTSKRHTMSCGCLQKNIISRRNQEYRDKNNIIGTKFNHLTVKSFVGIKNNESIYEFMCDCGNVVNLPMHRVKSGNTKSCGCAFKAFLDVSKYDIIGMKFGKLTVLSYAGTNKWDASTFQCLCDCGNIVNVSRNSLIDGNTKSCGCLVSVGENNIQCILNEANIEYQKQYTFDDLVSQKSYKLPYDFAILDKTNVIRLIEFDGEQHKKSFDYFGGEDKFKKILQNDAIKNQYALSHNIPLVRIPYSKRDSMYIDDLLGDKYLIKEND